MHWAAHRLVLPTSQCFEVRAGRAPAVLGALQACKHRYRNVPSAEERISLLPHVGPACWKRKRGRVHFFDPEAA